MKEKSKWEIELDAVLEEDEFGYSHDHFGHNTEFYDAKHYFRKLEKLGAKISIKDEYTAVIDLPFQRTKRNQVFLYILTSTHMPSECRYSKKKDALTLEWHY